MKTKDLIASLTNQDPEAEVYFIYHNGQQVIAVKVTDVDEGHVGHSPFVDKYVLVQETHPNAEVVVVLS